MPTGQVTCPIPPVLVAIQTSLTPPARWKKLMGSEETAVLSMSNHGNVQELSASVRLLGVLQVGHYPINYMSWSILTAYRFDATVNYRIHPLEGLIGCAGICASSVFWGLVVFIMGVFSKVITLHYELFIPPLRMPCIKVCLPRR